MVIGPRLDLRTSQTLVVSPQLQAAIRLLTLSNLELRHEIAAEVDQNPLLDLADGDGLRSNEPGDGAARETAGEAGDSDFSDSDFSGDSGGDPGDIGSALRQGDGVLAAGGQDVDYVEERFHHDCPADRAPPSGIEDRGLDRFAAAEPSLAEVLARQVDHLAAADQPLALLLVAALDEAGYLLEPLPELAARLGVALADAERVLLLVQQFEPTGVAARSLAECIALQAREADRYDPAMAALIDHLDLVAKGDLAQLRRLCGVDSDDLSDMLRELRGYDPKPGLRYGGSRSVPIVPDLFVRRNGAGWLVELNGATLPRLILDRSYRARVSGRSDRLPGEEERREQRFLDRCLTRAQWLMKTLDQRATTILKVATAIVEEQQAFFANGVLHLHPLTLRQIADRIGMHESTVSRVTSNKYLSCERGVFDLKYFFTASIQSADGEDLSAASVRSRLRVLIEAEEPLQPLSDDRLAELLQEDGVEIARRTVAKYREELHIPSSFQRRRRAKLASA